MARSPALVWVLPALLAAACSAAPTPATPAPPTATAAPTPIVEPTATATGSAADALTLTTAAGTREDPVPPGEAARVGDYLVRVDSVVADATAAVIAEYHENDPPPEGRVYPLIGVTIAFIGEGAGQFTFDSTFILEGPPGNDVLYTRNQSCGTIPGDVVYLGQFFPDSPLRQGNLCRAVPPEELPTLLVHLFPNLPVGDPGAYFSLPPPA